MPATVRESVRAQDMTGGCGPTARVWNTRRQL